MAEARNLAGHLDTPQDVLLHRWVNRWAKYGLSTDAAERQARMNDLPGRARIADTLSAADATM